MWCRIGLALERKVYAESCEVSHQAQEASFLIARFIMSQWTTESVLGKKGLPGVGTAALWSPNLDSSPKCVADGMPLTLPAVMYTDGLVSRHAQNAYNVPKACSRQRQAHSWAGHIRGQGNSGPSKAVLTTTVYFVFACPLSHIIRLSSKDVQWHT